MSELKKNGEAQEQQDVHRLMRVRFDKLNKLRATGKDLFETTTYKQSHHAAETKVHFDKLKDTEVSTAGRMMSKRIMGKASFCAVRDLSGDTQIYVACDAVGEEAYAQLKKYGIGDIIGVRGKALETKTDEILIHAEELTLPMKSMQPPPGKSHGLADIDQRYRQRYIDFVMNPEVRETSVKRSKIISSTWRYLDDRGLMGVETSMLASNAGGVAACPFGAHYNALSEDVKLRISLESYLKRPIVGGLKRVYEVGCASQNEGSDACHNPELTLTELYQVHTDYEGIMNLTEDMFRHMTREVSGSAKIMYSGIEIDLEKPFRRITMTEAVREYSGVDLATIETLGEARAAVKEKSVAFEERHQRGDILNPLFETSCEEYTIQPTFVTDHPIEISPLTKKKLNNPDYVERSELFIYGREMCSAYSELNDPIDQCKRPKAQNALAVTGDEEVNHTDEGSPNALNVGMPPIGGIGYGIDCLVMLLINSPATRNVLLFPAMKTMKAENKEIHGESEGRTEEANSFFTPNEKIDFSGVKIEPLSEDQMDLETFSKSNFRAVKVKGRKTVPKSKKLLQFTLDDGIGTERTILSGIHAYYEPEEPIRKILIAITSLPSCPTMGIESCGMLFSVVNERNGEEELRLPMIDNHIPARAKLY